MKKIIKISGILVCMAVLFLNISLNQKSSTGNIDLSKLIVTNEADAECVQTEYSNGVCWTIMQECFLAAGEYECDTRF